MLGAVVFEGYPFFQVQFLTVINAVHAAYYIGVRPQEGSRRYRMEAANECVILLLSYHMFLFTPFVAQPHTQYTIGFSFIGVVAFLLLSNAVNFTHITY